MPSGTRTSQYLAVGAVSGEFTNPMQPGQQYVFTASTDCWIKVGVTGAGGDAAADTADNILYVSGQPPLPLCSPDNSGTTTNSYVHVIRDAADGDATLTIVEGA